MKTIAIACAMLAGSFGFSSLAVAQDGRRDRDGDRGDRWEQRQDHRREARQDRREDRRDQQRAYRNGYAAGAHSQQNYVYSRPSYSYPQPSYSYSQPGYSYSRPSYSHSQPTYTYSQPSHVYSQPGYGYGYSQPRHGTRWQRGGYLPYEYRGNSYHVNNWNAHPGLYAPPYGHQWVNVGSDYLLVALATGLIANLLVN